MRNKTLKAESKRSETIRRYKLAKEIKTLRRDNRITQADLGRLCNLSASRIGHCENYYPRVTAKTLSGILTKLKESLIIMIE